MLEQNIPAVFIFEKRYVSVCIGHEFGFALYFKLALSSYRKRRAKLVCEQTPILVGRNFHSERSHGCCPVGSTGGSLRCGRYVLALLAGNEKWSKELMVIRVRPTPTRFPTTVLNAPGEQHTLAFHIYCVSSVRLQFNFRGPGNQMHIADDIALYVFGNDCIHRIMNLRHKLAVASNSLNGHIC